MKFRILFLLLFLAPILVDAQSPWTPGKGKQYHQLSFTMVPSYNQLYVTDGSLEINRFITDNTIQSYSEIGIGDKISLTAIIPLKVIKVGKQTDPQGLISSPDEQTFTNFGDVQLAFKYNFLRKGNWAFGASLLTSFPTATSEYHGLRSGFDSFHVRPSLSWCLSQPNFYAYGFFSYNWFKERIDPSLYWGIEFGYKITEDFIIAAQISSIHTLEDLETGLSAFDVGAGLYEKGFEYSAVLIKVIKEFIPERFGMMASIGGGKGNLVAQSPALTLGAYLKMDWNQ